MRLLQIDPNGSETTALDFHPMVTVVTGLTPAGRDIVLRVAGSLPRSADPGYNGLLEAHGVLFDLSRSTLELLDLQSDIDVLVAAPDLPAGVQQQGTTQQLRGEQASEPGAGPTTSDEPATDEPATDDSSTGEATGEATGDLNAGKSGESSRGREEVLDFIESAPPGLSEEFDQAKRRRADAREALGILREAAAKAQVEFDKVLARQKMAEAELNVARESSGAMLRLVVDETEAEPQIDIGEVLRQRAELTGKIDAAEGRIAVIARGLEELSAIDTRPLSVLLDAIHNPQPIEYVPSERAHELADEVIDLERRVADLEAELDKRGLASGAALKQLEGSRQELANAEKAMRKPELTPEDVTELEAAHEAVLDAETKAGGAFKRGGQKRLDQAINRQQEVLDRIGFPTWSAYVMGAGLLAIDHAAEMRLEKARSDMEAAEAHWGHVCEEIEGNPEHRHLLDRIEEVYLEAFDLLGGQEPEDLEAALRELQVPKREVTNEELVDALAYQLELVGLQLPEGAGADLTIMAAEAFIDEASAIYSRIAELRDERATIEAEAAVARGLLGELPEVDASLIEAQPGEEPDEPGGGGSQADPWGTFETAAPEGAAQPPSRSGFEPFDPSDPFGLNVPAEQAADEPPGQEQQDQAGAVAGEITDQPRGEGAEPAEGRGPGEIDSDLEHLRVALDEANEEVAEYTEWVESREALVDAALTVETVAASRLMKIAADLMDQLRDESEGILTRGGASDTYDPATGVMSDAPASDNGSSPPAAPPRVEDVEGYLADRIATQRHVSYAGSVPLVLDDALSGLEAPDVREVLDYLQSASDTVQVIYLTDDAGVAGWAEQIGFQRAAVVPAPPGFG